MNKITLIGNVTKDPELRTTPNGKSVCSIDIAVDRKRSTEKATDFFKVVTWGVLAENSAKYVKKGMKIAAVGELQARTYETKTGKTNLSLDVQADEVEFLTRVEEPKKAKKQEDGWQDLNTSELPF